MKKKKIIAYSLWGDSHKYNVGAIRNAELAQTIYPDWISRFYVSDCVPQSTIQALRGIPNTEIVEKGPGDWDGMFWRFEPASESDVYAMISRDTDSRLSWREKHAVDAWLESDKDFHIMRDHPWHGTAILGGMWGVRNGLLSDLKDLMNSYKKGNYWQVDQNFLRELVLPRVQHTVLTHDPFFEHKPFPTERENLEFVGEVFDEYENNTPEHTVIMEQYLARA